jgi:hypothetical protein
MAGGNPGEYTLCVYIPRAPNEQHDVYILNPEDSEPLLLFCY